MKIVVQMLFVEKSIRYTRGGDVIGAVKRPVMVIFSDKIYSFSRWEFYLIK
jgi:hypothetical protein